MKKFSFKKPDFSQFKIKPFWKKLGSEPEPDAAAAAPQPTMQEEKKDIPRPNPFRKKPEQESAGAKPQPLKSDAKESPEVARLKKELSAWRWVAASCAFAALSAMLLLG